MGFIVQFGQFTKQELNTILCLNMGNTVKSYQNVTEKFSMFVPIISKIRVRVGLCFLLPERYETPF